MAEQALGSAGILLRSGWENAGGTPVPAFLEILQLSEMRPKAFNEAGHRSRSSAAGDDASKQCISPGDDNFSEELAAFLKAEGVGQAFKREGAVNDGANA